MRDLIKMIRLMQIDLILENDKLKNKLREKTTRERRQKQGTFREFPYKRKVA